MRSYRDSKIVPAIGTLTDAAIERLMREMEAERFDCQYCKQNLCVTYDYACGDVDESTCYGCWAALGYLRTGDADLLRIVSDPGLHIAAMKRELRPGFFCGFCGAWRETWQRTFKDCGIWHCNNCADALAALNDGADDALKIFRGDSA